MKWAWTLLLKKDLTVEQNDIIEPNSVHPNMGSVCGHLKKDAATGHLVAS